jgi:anti-sigma regulatory factor (Ser/Thr protein kinase)
MFPLFDARRGGRPLGRGILLSTATEREFELAGGPYAATAARLALDNLDAELDPVLAQDLRLLVTEAVKNSVQHAGVGPEDSIGLKVSVQSDMIRIEVTDDGPGFEPDASRPTEDEVTGWGLFLIDQLSERWGVVRDKGTTVWFEVGRGDQTSRQESAS